MNKLRELVGRTESAQEEQIVSVPVTDKEADELKTLLRGMKKM